MTGLGPRMGFSLGLSGVSPLSLSAAPVVGDLTQVFGFHSISNSCRYCAQIIANLNFGNSCFLIWVKRDLVCMFAGQFFGKVVINWFYYIILNKYG